MNIYDCSALLLYVCKFHIIFSFGGLINVMIWKVFFFFGVGLLFLPLEGHLQLTFMLVFIFNFVFCWGFFWYLAFDESNI